MSFNICRGTLGSLAMLALAYVYFEDETGRNADRIVELVRR
jgi:hypothetical protein